MKFLLHTADVDKIKDLISWFPIDGITTNQTLLASEQNTIKHLKKIRETIGSELTLHVPVTSENIDDMVKEAIYLSRLLGPNTYIKIPCSIDGFKAMRKLHNKVRINATAIFSVSQAVMAARCGAKYVSPFVGRMYENGKDGSKLVADMVKVFDKHDFECKIMATSFRSDEQVDKTIASGIDAITVKPEILEELLIEDLTEEAIKNFSADWKKYHDKKIADLI